LHARGEPVEHVLRVRGEEVAACAETERNSCAELLLGDLPERERLTRQPAVDGSAPLPPNASGLDPRRAGADPLPLEDDDGDSGLPELAGDGEPHDPGPDHENLSRPVDHDLQLLRTSVAEMRLYDLRVIVERIEGRSVCGMRPGDYFELVESSKLRIPEGSHFCAYALQAVLPLLPAKQRRLPDEDWLEQESLVCCPDPDERLIMRIERIGERVMRSEDLT
jgi:uncharacterized repeat protein (TIGR04076 family)